LPPKPAYLMKLQNNDYKILIVDSSLMIVDRLYGLLMELGSFNTVSKAYTYTDALDKLSTDKFDIVLLDTQLQGKSGFELLSFIKGNFPDIKTIMLTNQTSTFYRNKGERIGADHFIDKSSEFEKVVDIIKEYALGYQMN
jgi:two-component system OmpR family response regulator